MLFFAPQCPVSSRWPLRPSSCRDSLYTSSSVTPLSRIPPDASLFAPAIFLLPPPETLTRGTISPIHVAIIAIRGPELQVVFRAS